MNPESPNKALWGVETELQWSYSFRATVLLQLLARWRWERGWRDRCLENPSLTPHIFRLIISPLHANPFPLSNFLPAMRPITCSGTYTDRLNLAKRGVAYSFRRSKTKSFRFARSIRVNHFESFLYLISKLKNSVSQGLSGLLDRLSKPCVKVRRFRQ